MGALACLTKRRWRVVFVGDLPWQPTRWYERFMDKDYLHCFALTYDHAADCWLVVDPNRAITEAYAIPGDPGRYPMSDDEMAWYTDIVPFDAEPRHGLRARSVLAPFTCVEVIKSLLGVRWPWVLTPRQLHRRLVKEV